MAIAVSAEHVALHDAVRAWVDRRVPGNAVRFALGAEHEQLPTFWDDLLSQGWHSLHVDEEHGGVGYSLAELAVVIEVFGRAVLPGPFLPTVLAAAVLDIAASAAGAGGHSAGGDHGVRDALRALVAGRAIGSVALGNTGLRLDARDGVNVLSGSSGPVVGGALADYVLSTAHTPAGERWVVVPTAQATVTALDSLDATRRAAELVWSDLVVSDTAVLVGVDTPHVRAVADTLYAAEAAGVARWCLDTAVDHVKIREQFGRPVGQFQAVKHRAADMLAEVEAAGAVAWDAARACSGPSDQFALAAVVAAAVAPRAADSCARACIQLLGGIGFTWEHDVHIYLKRALAIGAVVGTHRRREEQVACHMLAGNRRALTPTLPAEVEAKRGSVRDFLRETAVLESAPQRMALADAGYLMPHLPPPWGLSATPAVQVLLDEELHRAGIERPFLAHVSFVVPTLVHSGTAAQQELIAPTLRGELRWCQLFSEPGAGSDLAAARTRAVRVDGGWSITGQKVWTTLAHESDMGVCLARTDPVAPKHRGLSYFLVDMKAHGVEVRPLVEITGGQHFNEVYLDDVFVPDDNLVGDLGNGWRVSQATLGFERTAMSGHGSLGELARDLTTLVAGRADLRTDRQVLADCGHLLAREQVAAVMRLRTSERALIGELPGPEVSVLKVLVNENQQAIAELGLELTGLAALDRTGVAAPWIRAVLYSRCLTIAGGTSEIHRNLLAERVLGLPREAA